MVGDLKGRKKHWGRNKWRKLKSRSWLAEATFLRVIVQNYTISNCQWDWNLNLLIPFFESSYFIKMSSGQFKHSEITFCK